MEQMMNESLSKYSASAFVFAILLIAMFIFLWQMYVLTKAAYRKDFESFRSLSDRITASGKQFSAKDVYTMVLHQVAPYYPRAHSPEEVQEFLKTSLQNLPPDSDVTPFMLWALVHFDLASIVKFKLLEQQT